jgi:hypothetical protein
MSLSEKNVNAELQISLKCLEINNFKDGLIIKHE